MTAKELAKRLKTAQAPWILDVRSGPEYRSGHIPRARHLPFWAASLNTSELPPDRQTLIVLTCEHGPRAALAVSMLRLRGYRNLVLLEGHMAGWRRAKFPLDKAG